MIHNEIFFRVKFTKLSTFKVFNEYTLSTEQHNRYGNYSSYMSLIAQLKVVGHTF